MFIIYNIIIFRGAKIIIFSITEIFTLKKYFKNYFPIKQLYYFCVFIIEHNINLTSNIMKSLYTFALTVIVCINVSAQQAEKIRWYSIDEAMKLNATAPRKILIDVYTDWCGYCKIMDSETFNNPVIARYINQNFYAIKFNAESTDPISFAGHKFENQGPGSGSRRATHQFTQALGVTGYPTVVYFTGDLKMIGPVPGFYRPEKMEPLLHFIVQEKYTSTSLEEFEKTFVGELKKK